MNATTAIIILIIVGTGAPPYLIFIVQIQHLNFILFSQLCQVFHSETHDKRMNDPLFLTLPAVSFLRI